jgi:hypothetical protein
MPARRDRNLARLQPPLAASSPPAKIFFRLSRCYSDGLALKLHGLAVSVKLLISLTFDGGRTRARTLGGERGRTGRKVPGLERASRLLFPGQSFDDKLSLRSMLDERHGLLRLVKPFEEPLNAKSRACRVATLRQQHKLNALDRIDNIDAEGARDDGRVRKAEHCPRLRL